MVVQLADDRGIRPPHLVIGRGECLAQLGPAEGAAYGDVDVRSQPPLRLHGGEVLHVIAEGTLKRQMYGRANLDLLRKRVLMTP